MEINDLDIVEYTTCEGIPTDCTYSKVMNLAIVSPGRQFDFWMKLNASWIVAENRWWRWN